MIIIINNTSVINNIHIIITVGTYSKCATFFPFK